MAGFYPYEIAQTPELRYGQNQPVPMAAPAAAPVDQASQYQQNMAKPLFWGLTPRDLAAMGAAVSQSSRAGGSLGQGILAGMTGFMGSRAQQDDEQTKRHNDAIIKKQDADTYAAKLQNMQLENRAALRKEEQASAAQPLLAELVAKVQAGELSQEQANLEYAKIIGDYSGVFGGKSEGSPAAIREYQFYNQLSPAAQQQFLSVKRANQMFDRGGSQVVLDPTGRTLAEFGKTLSPEALPSVRYAQTAAAEAARNEATVDAGYLKKQVSAKDLNADADLALSKLKHASGSRIGSWYTSAKSNVGISDATTQANRDLGVIGARMVSNVPRMEGPQGVADLALYERMAGNIADPTVPIGDKRAAIATIKSINARQVAYQSRNGGYSPAPKAPQKSTGTTKSGISYTVH